MPLATLEPPMLATPELSEFQVTLLVITWLVESLKIPVAVKPCFVPAAIDRPEGVTEIETKVAFVTVRTTDALNVPNVAVMVAVPGASPLITPLLAPTVAVVVSEEFQTACKVRFLVPPSSNSPVSTRLVVVVAAITGLAGEIVSDDTFAVFTLRDVELETEVGYHWAVIVTVPTFLAVAMPLTVMAATLFADELQLTASVISCVLPSEKVPDAVNCCRVPNGIEAT